MGTRTNFYKNSSLSYKRDVSLSSVLQNLRAYNIATGNAPPIEQKPPADERKSSLKRRRVYKPPPSLNREIEESHGPMSHQDYIAKRRKEISSPQAYEELPADILGTSGTGINLVGYESDGSASSESKERQDCPTSGQLNEVNQVKRWSEQRFPHPGETICVMCGKYGEYICDETNDDICSLECKADLLESRKLTKAPLMNKNPDVSSSELKCPLPVPEFEEDTWDYKCHRWSKKRSSLCTFECWKCQKPGHLAEDCLLITSNQVRVEQNKSNSISRDLLQLYRRCHQIGRNLSAANCNECCSSISLATCLDCSTVFCDSAGHLNEHVRSHPSHRQYYSHKLKRLVKCCKSTCKVTDIKDLLVCHYCFDKAFNKFYDMYTATWKGTGLSMIRGSICCEDHFTWHRMNCLNADVENSAFIVSKKTEKDKHIQLSDFIF